MFRSISASDLAEAGAGAIHAMDGAGAGQAMVGATLVVAMAGAIQDGAGAIQAGAGVRDGVIILLIIHHIMEITLTGKDMRTIRADSIPEACIMKGL